MTRRSSWFQRFLLPAFAFKAVIIGGGYATGRELAEFFMPSGPWGGLLGMLLATVIWSVVCVVTFMFAHATASEDYRTFFRRLLGRFGVAFEAAYFVFVVLILAVFGAAAGAIGGVTFGWPVLAGTIVLMGLIAGFAFLGNAAVEQLFKYVSMFIYAVYAVFLVLCLSKFGDRIVTGLSAPTPIGHGWALGGLTYAGYNIIGAVVILPMIRHLTSRRDAVVAGLICGPLAMLPAALFYICMIAYYPGIGAATLPSDVLLQKLDLPIFRVLFQVMIFTALLESGTGIVHAVNERIAHTWMARRGTVIPRVARLCAAVVLLVGSIFLAGRFGLVDLIAKGYRLLAWVFITVYVVPLLTVGVWKLRRLHHAGAGAAMGSSPLARPALTEQRGTP
jgi:uncharacterized membrane protein YkvI